ncbi:cilia- and flagella-associated protein 206 isoform X2 [Melanotaenia boesemani]|uniref:cilia- and flagella-associated protein 206 isoform X2 n=1 Tax=Melanotaenia boesemani TaxID=1250792 RepID=UPI001C057BBD|nr:cilia- and flagella-associated protein 206 isoform X2 [Melanotaenia boesemani]
MAQAQEESVIIKNITREIVQEYEQRGHPVSDMLATFMVKALLLVPGNVDLQRLKQVCLRKLMEESSPSLDTIKMQVYFDMNYTPRCTFLEEIHDVLVSKLSTLSREITDSRIKTRSELNALYHKITTYILLRSAMGSPTDVNAVEEATAALQSIFPKTELGAFIVLLKREKEQLLKELTLFVTGIRLFNKVNKKEDDELNIHDLMPATLNEALPVTIESIKKMMSVTQSLMWKYTAVLEKLTDPDFQSGQQHVPIVLLKQALYNFRQHEVFLKILLNDACLCAKHIESLQAEIWSQLKLLKQKVKPKTAVPTAVVSPLFMVLSKLWFEVQDEAELLTSLGNLTVGLQPFLTSQAKSFSELYPDSLLEAAKVKTDEQRRAESDEPISETQWKTKEWLLPETTSSFNELPLQYSGFCGYMLVKRDGILLPGNPNIGVLKHKEKLYAFSSKEAALEFAACPDDFIAEVAEKTKHFPELLQLLQLSQQFSCVSANAEEESLLVKSIIKCEIGTQTVLHPTESNIDKSYEWNNWELRRQALKLADLRTKVTHSVQTDLSHMRRENATQTWLPKDAASQSKKDGGSNVPKPQIYLAGLRGQRGPPVVKTDLTRSVDD